MPSLQSHHVGVVVSDLDEATTFYRDTLGLPVAAEFTLSEDGIGTAIGVDGVSGEFVHLDAGGSRIELIEYTPSGRVIRPEMIHQPGAMHIGFSVEDIDAFSNGLPSEADPLSSPQLVDTGSRILFFTDPDGNFVEVVEDEG